MRSLRLFWPLKMVPSIARGHFGAKKVLSSSKTPRRAPLFVFPAKKRNYPKLVESAVHWYFYVPMAYNPYILMQRAQKHPKLIEKPLKMADFLQYLPTYCGGHMRKCTKKIQEICDFLSHTDWVYTYCFCLKPINFV